MGAGEFEPPLIESIPDVISKESLLLFKAKKEPDYTGRRFTGINSAHSHYIFKSDLFKDEFGLYKLPAIDTSRYRTDRLPVFRLRYPFLGRERFSDTAGFLQPEFIREVKTLNDVAGFVTIKNKKDAIEYVRMASSRLTSFYFLPRMKELYCVRELPPRVVASMGTLDECAQFGLKQPAVKKLKIPEVRIESDTSGFRLKLTTKSAKDKIAVEDDENEVDDDGNEGKEGKDRDRIVFRVTRNVVIDSELGIFRVTEEVGQNGEWRIVNKRLIQPFSEQIRKLLGPRTANDTSTILHPQIHPEKRKQK